MKYGIKDIKALLNDPILASMDEELKSVFTPGYFLTMINRAVRYRVKKKSQWEEEKTDILERANWLCEKVIRAPKLLIDDMPKNLGEHYAGEWAIYTCSHLVCALTNICKLYPDQKELCLQRMEKIIDVVNTPEIRSYDTNMWGGDAIKDLDKVNVDNTHMTYLSILAWCITNYKIAGGTSGRFDALLDGCCEALNRSMLESPDLCLLSFPDTPIFLPDMFFAIVALKNYSVLNNGKYGDSVEKWIKKAKKDFIHQPTGLLVSRLRTGNDNRGNISGCYTALNCYCLTQIDRQFAHQQYELMKSHFVKKISLLGLRPTGIRENLYTMPQFKFDVDAGPIILDFSPSGIAWAIGAATYFGDWQLRNELMRTAEIAGDTVKDKNSRHYRLGEYAPVGESVVLAMRTNI